MSRGCHHHRRTAHHSGRGRRRPGPIYRVTRGIADKLGVSRKLILVAFIIGLIINLPLTVLLFLIALYWVDRPGRLERGPAAAVGGLRGAWPDRRANAGPSETVEHEDPDLQFQALRARFAELEHRAGSIEEHVASDEFRLDRELGNMRARDGH